MPSSLLLKRLSPTELAWFGVRGHELHPHGPRLDDAVVQEWIAPTEDRVEVRARWHDGTRALEDLRWIERHSGSWWLAGKPLSGRRLAKTRDRDIAVLALDRLHDVTGGVRGLVTVDVLPRDAEGDAAELARKLLAGHAAITVEGKARSRLLGLVRQDLPAFGGGRSWAVEGLTERQWSALRAWLVRYVRVPALRALLETRSASEVRAVLERLGQPAPPDRRQELALEVIRSFGTELLVDPERRRVLAEERFRRQKRRPPVVRQWTRGSMAAHRFVRTLDLPTPLVGQPYPPELDFEDLTPFPPFGPLHDYQQQIATGLRAAIHAETPAGRRAVVWLPTGTGKTRVCVETLLMETFLAPPRNCLLWIADREELCEQAIATFRHVWMIRGHETPSARGVHAPMLRVIRMWGGRPWQDPPGFPTLIVASIQTLARRAESRDFARRLGELGERCAAVIFDEAHHVVAPSYERVIEALGLASAGRVRREGPALIGLTATPARTQRDETEALARRFRGQLLEPNDPYRSLDGFIAGGYLARPRFEVVPTGYELTAEEDETWDCYHTLPRSTLRQAGADPVRTARIVAELEPRLADLDSVLVFAISVQHAETIAEVLTRRGYRALALHGGSPRGIRHGVIRRFRERSLQVLVTCELLATGFDAPNVDAVVLARPTESRVLYAQMIGRGLRGPLNGGTEECLVLDYEDRIGPFSDLDALRLSFRTEFIAGAGG